MEQFTLQELRKMISIDKFNGRKVLDLSNRTLSKIPSALSELTELEVLDLGWNKLNEFPESVCELEQLEELFVGSNNLRVLPNSLCKMKKLRVLWLSYNKLSSLPNDCAELEELVELYVRNNELRVLPNSFCTMKKLRWLDLSNNKLSSLPDGFTELKLDVLSVYGNPFTVEEKRKVEKIQNRIKHGRDEAEEGEGGGGASAASEEEEEEEEEEGEGEGEKGGQQIEEEAAPAAAVYKGIDQKGNLQNQLREVEQQLTKVQRQLREEELQAANLHQQPREKNQQQEMSQEQLRHMEQLVTRMEQQLREKGRELENSEKISREREQQLTHFQRQLREKELQEASLHEQLREKNRQQEQLRRMEQQLREKNHELENSERISRNRKKQLRKRTQQQEILQRQLRERDQRLTEKGEQEKNLQRRLRELAERCREKEDESSNLQQQVATLQGQLRAKDQEVNELETTLSTAQLALSEQQRHQSPDWVIPRDQIQLTDNLLGRGGWGNVIKGKYCGCAVAVKQIHQLILSPHNQNLFEREMDIASRCRHPCLLQFIGATNDEGNPLFVTELMESSLRALLEQQPLSVAEVSIISLDVARALSYLHHKTPPIIHRDISSANVLLWRQGDQWRGKVSDYGTANFMQHTMTVAPGAMIYMAPESRTSNQTVKVDVYSFGVLLCEMCIRQLPDPQRRDGQIAMVTNRLLRALIRRCVQTEPETRPNMEEIIEEFEKSV